LYKLRNILFWVFGIFISLVALAGWLFSGQALAPINRIMNQVDTLLPSDLTRRLDFTDQNDELSRLTKTFNKLLDRVQNAFSTQKLFLSNISHELKNPMNVIISQLEIALTKDRSKADYQDTIVSVLEDVKELNDVSTKLMQLARINSDGTDIVFTWFRIDEALWQTRDSLLRSHPSFSANVQIIDLPESEESLLIWGNEQLLRTALYNLMENACKYSPENKVTVQLAFNNGLILLEIQDSGAGIPEGEIPMIFNPFYRSSQTTMVRGSGIGLSLVDNIMKLHNVPMKLTSTLEVGTTFYLEFTSYPISEEVVGNKVEN
jgi:signal transduction histidine kinase